MLGCWSRHPTAGAAPRHIDERLRDGRSFPDRSNDGRRTIERAQAMRRYGDNEGKFGFIDHQIVLRVAKQPRARCFCCRI
jgi:hypothetical protein